MFLVDLRKCPKILLVSWLCCLAGAGLARAKSKTPLALDFKEKIWDFGEVSRGEKLIHEFSFVNVGNSPLRILGIHSTCGCTATVTDTTRTYAPGEEGEVRVELDTTHYSGKLVRLVTVMTNLPLLSSYSLTVKAQIKPLIQADPPLVDFGNILAGEASAARKVHVRSLQKGTKLEVSSVRFNKELFQVTWGEQGDEWVLDLRLKKTAPVGFLKEKIVVVNNSLTLREMEIPVRAEIKGNIALTPPYLEFGAVQPGKKKVREFRLKSAHPFRIVSHKTLLFFNGDPVADPGNFLDLEGLTEKESPLNKIRVTLHNKSGRVGSLNGRLVLQTSDPIQREILVDFYGFLMKRVAAK